MYHKIQKKIQMMKILKFLVLHSKKINRNHKVHFSLREEEVDHPEARIKHQKKDSKIKCKKYLSKLTKCIVLI